jgi:OOP family OmpA-OmpF porin
MALCCAAGLAAGSAQAQSLYLGASLGSPHFGDRVNGIQGSGSGLAGKIFAGYPFTPNFALEGGFADLGHIDNGNGKVDGSGEFLDAVGLWPLSDQWSLLGRVGLAHVKLDTSAGDAGGTGLKLGLGAQYTLTGNFALRGEWERYRPSAFGDKPNIDQFTLGVRYGF